MEKLLVVEDSVEIQKQLKWGLGKEYKIIPAGTADQALELFDTHGPKVVTLDLGLPPEAEGAQEGLRCIRELLQRNRSAKVIVLTGHDERENALKAVQSGAYDFYQKPIALEELKVILSRAFHLAGLEAELGRLHTALEKERASLFGIFGQCPAMVEVFNTIRKVATCDVPVLLLGESGTGKELVARAIHEESLRKKGRFIPINCGAIPENLLESELFGHEKGAFTGAMGRVQGKVEFADEGTLFLDEIGELALPLQVKLLRFLQEKSIQRVGGREDIQVDARIIAATNIDVEKAIEGGGFREDLYYRIGVITINLPPLRERGDDIILLANLFLQRYSEGFRKRIRGFSAAALEALRRHSWPGNVRELENKVKRAVVLAEMPIVEVGDLGFSKAVEESPGTDQRFDGLTLKQARDRLERDLVALAIEKQEGNIVKAADMLGVSRPTMYDLMKKHCLHVPHP
jgi:two-component system NtrC family response regulator